MALTLSRLMTNTESHDIKAIAGMSGMKSLVRWIHMVEDIAVPGFLHGNELVFTTGIAQKGTDWLSPFVQSLKAHGAVGLVLNIGPYISDIPKDVIDYCNNAEFSLFTIPWERRLTDVTYDLCRRVIASEENESGIASVFRALLFSKQTRDGDLRLLSKRGFYNSLDYTFMLITAYRGDLLLSGDEWDSLKVTVQDTMLQCVNKPVFCFTEDNYFAIIAGGVNAEVMERCAEAIKSEIFPERHDIKIYSGISDTVSGFLELSVCYRQAVAAVNTARHEKQLFLSYEKLGVEKIIHAVDNTGVLMRFADDVLGKIISYDTLHGTDFAATLSGYIKNNGSIQQQAAETGMHRNTINNKMKAIREQFGLKMDYNDIANLHLAFTIRDILQR